VVLVIEENHMFTEVYPQGMPWLVAQGNANAYATNYHADEPGSALDYFWLSSGSGEAAWEGRPAFCEGDGCANAIDSDNIFRELTKAGLTWKIYADSLPSVGWVGGSTGAYLDRHVPAVWYTDLQNFQTDPVTGIKTTLPFSAAQLAQQQNVVPFTQLAVDMANNQLPDYSLIIPDANHDAHDGTVLEADQWLAANVAPLLNQPYFQPGGDGLMIVTFDECDAAIGDCPEYIYTAVIGPNVKPGFTSPVLYKHENTLRTMLDALGITTYPGASQTAADMADFFK
jgi:phospholipase C